MSSEPLSPEPLVLSKETLNGFRVLALNRPKAMNAADKEMTSSMLSFLQNFESDASSKAFMITSSSARALCSGGDVKTIAAAVKADPCSQYPAKALANEYRLIHRIASSRIPSVAIMDGVTMGFGIGISGFAKYRVVTERTIVAMPENAIALIPDIAFSYLMRSKPSLATFLALTGARLGGKFSPTSDLLFAGIGTHYVPSDKLPALQKALESLSFGEDSEGALDTLLASFATEPDEPSALSKLMPVLERCCGKEQATPEAVRAAMAQEAKGGGDAAKALGEAIKGFDAGCPFTLATTLHHQRNVFDGGDRVHGIALDTLDGVLRMEYRVMTRLALRGDFAEGVRARLVDKDNSPTWSPLSLAEVSLTEVKACFEPIDSELDFPLPCKRFRDDDTA